MPKSTFSNSGAFCPLHNTLKIKYFCLTDKTGLCTECIVKHTKHDFIFANSDAANIVKKYFENCY